MPPKRCYELTDEQWDRIMSPMMSKTRPGGQAHESTKLRERDECGASGTSPSGVGVE